MVAMLLVRLFFMVVLPLWGAPLPDRSHVGAPKRRASERDLALPRGVSFLFEGLQAAFNERLDRHRESEL